MRLALITLALAAVPAMAQQDFSNVKVTAEQIAPGVHMLTGAGGNIAVLSGADGVILVDDQYAPLTPRIVDAVRKISPQPIRYVVNTHWHGDHTGGNENLGKAGAVIVAHDNVRRRMSRDQFMETFNSTVPASPAAALPVITFSDELTFHVNGQEIRVIHVEAAHTDGDSMIYLPGANVLHTGDVFFNGSFPFIDTSSGGSIHGIISAGDLALRLLNGGTTIIPGHGPKASIEDYRQYLEMLRTVRQRLETRIADGATLEQVLKDNPLADLNERWGGGFMKLDRFTTIVYGSLTPKLESGKGE